MVCRIRIALYYAGSGLGKGRRLGNAEAGGMEF